MLKIRFNALTLRDIFYPQPRYQYILSQKLLFFALVTTFFSVFRHALFLIFISIIHNVCIN